MCVALGEWGDRARMGFVEDDMSSKLECLDAQMGRMESDSPAENN